MNTVVFLQNAWSGLYAGGTWPRASWLRALHASRTGQRLGIMTAQCPGVPIWFDNTTPIVGLHPSSIVPADHEHMRRVIAEQQPAQLVACGRFAHEAIDALKLPIPTLYVPHPAARVLTNELYAAPAHA